MQAKPTVGPHAGPARIVEAFFEAYNSYTEQLDDSNFAKDSRREHLATAAPMREKYAKLFNARLPDHADAYKRPIPVKATPEERMTNLETGFSSLSAKVEHLLIIAKKNRRDVKAIRKACKAWGASHDEEMEGQEHGSDAELEEGETSGEGRTAETAASSSTEGSSDEEAAVPPLRKRVKPPGAPSAPTPSAKPASAVQPKKDTKSKAKAAAAAAVTSS